MSSTVMRVPATTGLPAMMFGCDQMSWLSIVLLCQRVRLWCTTSSLPPRSVYRSLTLRIGTPICQWTRFAARCPAFAQGLAVLLEEQVSLLDEARVRGEGLRRLAAGGIR